MLGYKRLVSGSADSEEANCNAVRYPYGEVLWQRTNVSARVRKYLGLPIAKCELGRGHSHIEP